jgi:predicted dithiol-disulfide oxidoreductase (DUF899 family)
MKQQSVQHHKIVSRNEWLSARKDLLLREKELTRARDALSALRRELPWVKIEKSYLFDTPSGKKSLSDLFDGRSQLIIYHFMWRHDLSTGCVGCSFLCDHVDGSNLHLSHHDVTFVACSRAPFLTLEAFKRRMGWHFSWVSSANSDFNFDYNVSFTKEQLASGSVNYNYQHTPATIDELSGISIFYKDPDGSIYHTYSSYGRGNEEVLGTYMYLDLTPNGRNEPGPNHNLSDWVRHHDSYDAAASIDPAGGFVPAKNEASSCHSAEHRA